MASAKCYLAPKERSTTVPATPGRSARRACVGTREKLSLFSCRLVASRVYYIRQLLRADTLDTMHASSRLMDLLARLIPPEQKRSGNRQDELLRGQALRII